MCRAGVEPAQPEGARVTASEARQCPADTITMAQEGFEPSAFLFLRKDGLPIAYRAKPIRGVGIEPTLPRSKRGGLPLADPRSNKKGQVSSCDTRPLRIAGIVSSVTSANAESDGSTNIDRRCSQYIGVPHTDLACKTLDCSLSLVMQSVSPNIPLHTY
jgi:hypothetical protein